MRASTKQNYEAVPMTELEETGDIDYGNNDDNEPLMTGEEGGVARGRPVSSRNWY